MREDRKIAALLFVNFFLIIVIYSVVRPVRGALVVDQLGAESLPYIWIYTALVLAIFVAIYGRLIDLVSPRWVMTLTATGFAVGLLWLRYCVLLQFPLAKQAFYVWGDVFSVVMIEQVWSFTNDVFDTETAKRVYGFIGSGAILGGILGSFGTRYLVGRVGTYRLLDVSFGLLLVLVVCCYLTQKIRAPGGAARSPQLGFDGDAFALVARQPYLRLILVMVLLTQLISTVIDYKFNWLMQLQYPYLDDKTRFLAGVNAWINVVSLAVTLAVAGPVHRYLGVATGLLFLPVFNLFMLGLAIFVPGPSVLTGLNLGDKSLNYSIYRLSKEHLYIPTASEAKYKAKAVIDMFVHRFSDLLGAGLILVVAVRYLSLCLAILTLVVIGMSLLVARAYRAKVGETGAEIALAPEIIS